MERLKNKSLYLLDMDGTIYFENELIDGAADFLKKVHAECSGRTVLCVSHGGFIKQILKCVMGVETFGITPKCENSSVSAFATSDGVRWQLLFWNDHSHLEHFTSSSGW